MPEPRANEAPRAHEDLHQPARAQMVALSILEASGAYPDAPRSRMRARDPILADSVVLVDGSALSAEYQ